jgi:hypothetical protein
MSLRKARSIRRGSTRGFALIEVMFAICILAFGLLALAALLAQLSGSTTQSRYLGTEVMLASEKLEDLNQLDYKAYKATALAAGGNLGTDSPNYFDQVQTSSRSGMVTDPSMAAQAANDMLTFKRRWVIENNNPTPGVQRVTVIVIPVTGTQVEKAATFQTSTVRPCDPSDGC